MSIYNVIFWVIVFFNDTAISTPTQLEAVQAVFKSLVYMVENKIVIKHN